ncbi:MAG: RagB/SusD family nutrient uptake outer membrane protein [Prevotella sp.]|nr:RagB/SusD family nutrient uptake outer membrane protein [Prevotella sp.]
MKYINILFLTGVLTLVCACTDLDTDIDSQYTSYPDSEIAVNAKLEGCYYYMRNEACLGRNYWEGVMLQGDEIMALCMDGGWYDNGRMLFPETHDLRYDTPGVGQMSDLMSGCTYTNTIISELGGPTLDDPLVAPLRAIRAFYLYMMMDEYGDTPLLNHVLDDDEEMVRTPRAEVAEYIESELLAVIPQLTEENNADTYGRPNKWMAYALLAKLYLNWGVYTNDITTVTYDTPNPKLDDCIAACDSIIEHGPFEVGTGYYKKFLPDNGVQIKDFIYAMPFDPETLGASYDGGHEMDRFLQFRNCNSTTDKDGNPSGPWGFQNTSNGGGIWILTPEAVARYNLPGDERNDMISTGYQYIRDYNNEYQLTDEILYYEGEPIVYTDITTYDGWQDFSTLDVGPTSQASSLMAGYRLAKYPCEENCYSQYSKKQGNDIPIFRYADILLTKAEAIYRGGTATRGDTPASLINEVRDCSGAAHVEAVEGTVTKQVLIDERGREFICEMWRRQDLIRFGMFEDDWGFKNTLNPGAKTELWRRLMPVPEGVMETNTNWSQNPGY